MSLLIYKLTLEIPIPSPEGDLPDHDEVMMTNEATGATVELHPADAQALRLFLADAWMRGRQLG